MKPFRRLWVVTAACAFAALTSAAADANAAAGCNRAAFRVILDVGHTRESPGAISARGVPEFEFNLSLARKVEARLLQTGFARTMLLVTGGPGRESLVQRVLRANAASADLFVSIHHDSVPQPFKEEWQIDGDPYWYSDRFKGHSIFVSQDNGQPAHSLAFARLLGQSLKSRGLHYAAHYKEPFMGRWRRSLVDAEAGVYRYDELIVLRATRMPAVLLEGGSIINRAEEIAVQSAERQDLIAAAAAEAVESFCAGRRVRS
jgi:N-acetylmuramoyl-L-alanine amidase